MAQRAALVRVAALLVSGDLAKAEDVVQTALTRLYVAWPRVRRGTAAGLTGCAKPFRHAQPQPARIAH